MTRTMLIASVRKECRALLPMWLACAAAIAAGAYLQRGALQVTAGLAYGFGSIALGAYAAGVEYSSRTVPLLLSLPAGRRALFGVKFAVLAPLLALLGIAASQLLFEGPDVRRVPDPRTFVLIAACGMSLAPLLTILSRSTVAGVVFTGAVVGLAALAARVAGDVRYGWADPEGSDRLQEAVFWPLMFGLCAISAPILVWLVGRLEYAGDSRGTEVRLPAMLRRSGPAAPAPRRRRAMTQLAVKELHLHQMALLVAVLYVAGFTALVMLQPEDPRFSPPLMPLTVVYVLTLPVLIGAVASAEERQLGTHEWQLLMPASVSHQWIVKVAVAIGVALALGAGVPFLAAALGPDADIARQVVSPPTVLGILLLTALSLYVSSVSTSGIRALVAAVPVVFGALVFVRWLSQAIWWTWWQHVRMDPLPLPPRLLWLPPVLAGVTMAAALLAAAMHNHRTAERSATRVARQIGSLVALTAIFITAMAVLGVD